MKHTVTTLQKQKEEGNKITMLTAYDYSMAKLINDAGIEMILVGDSLGMVMLGYEDTLAVTMEDMLHHTRAVARGASDAFVVADMPFLSYQVSVRQAVENAGRLIKEGHAKAVKLEGGAAVCDQIAAIVRASIPVVAHIGLTPQSIHALGGYKVQGKSEEAARQLLEDAKAVEGRRIFGCAGMRSSQAGAADLRDAAHSDHWHRRRERMRWTGAGVSGHAAYVF